MSPAQLDVVLGLVTPYLGDVHVLLALLGTSHSVRSTILPTVTPHVLFTLLARTRTPSSRLSGPLHLLSLIAPGLSAWLRSSRNRRRFVRAVREGTPGLVDLALRYPAITNAQPAPPSSSPLTLSSLSEHAVRRQEVMTSLTDLVDRCVGAQWYSTPNFWDGGVEDAYTLFAEPDEVIWRWVAYGEIFGPGVDELYAGLLGAQATAEDSVHPAVAGWRLLEDLRFCEVPLRCEYVKYILPDWHVRPTEHIGYQDDGISSPYPYPESLAAGSDVGEGRGGREDDGQAALVWGADGVSGADNELDRDGSDARHTELDRAAGELPTDTANDHQEGLDESTADPSSNTAHTQPTAPSTVHPLRATRPSGPYHRTAPPNSLAPGSSRMVSEHVAVLLHLFERSPLFRRVAARVRSRAIRLAHAQDPTLPYPAAQRRMRGLPPTVQAMARAKYGDPEFGDLRDWKQLFWEDALWTSGWDGLELLFDVWERDCKNDKARIRREKRAQELAHAVPGRTTDRSDQNRETGATATPDRAGTMSGTLLPPTGNASREGSIPDDHPGLQRLARIYAQLCRLRHEPKRVVFEATRRRGRSKVCTWLGPTMLGDLRAMYWSNLTGPSWQLRGD